MQTFHFHIFQFHNFVVAFVCTDVISILFDIFRCCITWYDLQTDWQIEEAVKEWTVDSTEYEFSIGQSILTITISGLYTDDIPTYCLTQWQKLFPHQFQPILVSLYWCLQIQYNQKQQSIWS